MASRPKLTNRDIEKGSRKLYHHVDCGHLSGLRVSLTTEGQKHKKQLAILGISSKESIKNGMRAATASPFKTVFVVDESSGAVLFALSQNEEYVAAAKKKKPKPKPPAPPPQPSQCCQICFSKGGYACDALSDGSCICYGATRETGGLSPEDSLDELR